jgi:KaiC/GvpD/RAD55 family RecA-like ATPase
MMEDAPEHYTRQILTSETLKRVKTGIGGLDELLSGGFPKNSVILVSGPPGSGKTILCYQFLYKGLEERDKCLFLSVNKKIEGVLNQARELGLDFQPAMEEGQIKFLSLDINKKLVYETLANEVISGSYDRVVLDSITPLSEMPIYTSNPGLINNISIIEEKEFSPDGNFPIIRLHLHFIMNTLETAECTSIVTSELPADSTNLSRDGFSEFLADGVIILSLDPAMDRRKLTIMKMRATKHTLKPQHIEIREGGITIL